MKNKKVEDISLTQDRLINGLLNIVKRDSYYLLDGHYCLFDKEGKVARVPLTTFEAINPLSLYLIIGNVEVIKFRLDARDQRNYDYKLLKDMQEQEITYAKELAEKFKIKLSIGREDNYSEIYWSLKNEIH